MAESLNSSQALRAGLKAVGKLDRWDNERRKCQAGYSPHDVKIHCVQNSEWQKIRLSMKGVDTSEKLAILEAWWDKQMEEAQQIEDIGSSSSGRSEDNRIRASALVWATEVQVGNYLGALKRGGQLDDSLRIRKAR